MKRQMCQRPAVRSNPKFVKVKGQSVCFFLVIKEIRKGNMVVHKNVTMKDIRQRERVSRRSEVQRIGPQETNMLVESGLGERWILLDRTRLVLTQRLESSR